MACAAGCSHNHGRSTTTHATHHMDSNDLDFLKSMLGSSSNAPKAKVPLAKSQMAQRRPTVMEPLILQTATLSGPQTRNHYMHGGLMYPHAKQYEASDDLDTKSTSPYLQSKQAPRNLRLGLSQEPKVAKSRRGSSTTGDRIALSKVLAATPSNSMAPLPDTPEQLKVTCHARTRVPTPHGDVFLHVYKNNRDAKEHLAFVFDRVQISTTSSLSEPPQLNWIRSTSLDSVWKSTETEDERIVRGAYVGRLSSENAVASSSSSSSPSFKQEEAPLVRIHSECFTGETIGSQRCDCGEQLDEAFRLISSSAKGKGVIVYLRQEGRGIGLLEKVKAYNLQDLGHDTVSANLLLGHHADSRTYDLAACILRDLGIDQVKLLTNNPDKMEQAEKEGIKVVERVSMVPRSWRSANERATRRKLRKRRAAKRINSSKPTTATEDDWEEEDEDSETDSNTSEHERGAGVGMIGAGLTDSAELDKYLKTKVQRMGHMLALPSPFTQPSTPVNEIDEPRMIARKKPKKNSLLKKTMQDSISSLITDTESLKCSSGCDCGDSSHASAEEKDVAS